MLHDVADLWVEHGVVLAAAAELAGGVPSLFDRIGASCTPWPTRGRRSSWPRAQLRRWPTADRPCDDRGAVLDERAKLLRPLPKRPVGGQVPRARRAAGQDLGPGRRDRGRRRNGLARSAPRRSGGAASAPARNAGGANIASVSDGPHRDGQSVRLVRDRLRDAILRGEIGAGEVRSQTSLSEEFGTGRSVVREALRLLDMEGLVIREPNKRVRVAELMAAGGGPVHRSPQPRDPGGAAHRPGHAVRRRRPARGTLRTHGPLWARQVLGRAHRAASCVPPEARGGGRLARRRAHPPALRCADRYQLAYVQQTIEEWATRQAEHRGLIDAATEGDAELVAWRLAEHYAGAAARLCLCLDPGHEPAKLRDTIHGLVPGCDAALEAVSSP